MKISPELQKKFLFSVLCILISLNGYEQKVEDPRNENSVKELDIDGYK